jgi:tRNA pseudouridine55 synthase
LSRRRQGRDINGILVLDKPWGESSNKSLQKVKRLFDAAKAGHTGSLDPLATGVLPLCFGEATKISQFLLDSDKTYRTTIKLGIKTDSGDSEGSIISTADSGNISLSTLEKALENFRGEILQTPSMYSALKHQGVPLYKLARQGKTVERKIRHVKVYDLQLLKFTEADSQAKVEAEVELEIHCSKGTYIRSIADDLGDLLGVGGHVTALRRLKAGPFTLADSVSYEDLQKKMDLGGFDVLDKHLIAPDTAILELPEIILTAASADLMRQGQIVPAKLLPAEGLVRLYEGGREKIFIGIGVIMEAGRVAPRRLLRSEATTKLYPEQEL